MDPRWRWLRLIHRWTFGLWLGWLPFGMLLLTVGERFLPSAVITIALFTYFGAFAVTAWTFSFLRCPKCRNPFLFKGLGFGAWQAPWAPRCVHCGARIGDPLTDKTSNQKA